MVNTVFEKNNRFHLKKDDMWIFLPHCSLWVWEWKPQCSKEDVESAWTDRSWTCPLLLSQPRTELTFWAVNAHCCLMSCFSPILSKSEGKAGHSLHAYLEAPGMRMLLPNLCHPALLMWPLFSYYACIRKRCPALSLLVSRKLIFTSLCQMCSYSVAETILSLLTLYPHFIFTLILFPKLSLNYELPGGPG